jgi:hypothetical protein
MKYVCLIYSERQRIDALPKPEWDAILAEYGAFSDGIRQTGQLVAAEALQPVQAAKTLRIRHGKLSVTDGPFAETKEQLGGFFLIEARDLAEAVQVASKIPGARWGSIEVRPVMQFDQQPARA